MEISVPGFNVSLETGPRAGDQFAGTLIYDDSLRLNGFGRRPLQHLAFTYEGETYRWGDSRFYLTPDEGFVPEVQAGGSVNNIPVILYGLSTFVADSERDLGIAFVPTTPTLGEYVEQSRLVYGGNVRFGGPFGGASFTNEGTGRVSYQTLPIPEPATTISIAVGGLLLSSARMSRLFAAKGNL